jgi:diguanylate cyclase (GGDEF)-like protein/PAS domain S-box-containing protein
MKRDLILCIDDEMSIISSLRTELFNNFEDKYLYEFASSATEAMEIIEEYMQDGIEIPLVITDCIMPGIRGDELLIQIHQKLPNTKSIMLTGQADIENIKNAINKANLYRYIEKPWDKEDLYLTINEALKSYYDSKELLTYQKELEEKIEQRTRDIKEYMSIVDKYVIHSTTDTKGVITYASEAFCNMSGYSKDELLGKKHNILRHPDMPKSLFENLWRTISSGKLWIGEMKNRSKSGGEYWVKNTISPIFRDEKIVGYSSIRVDITTKKMIEKLAITDDLTGLKNRRYFNQIFTKEINYAKDNKSSFQFIIFDIDYFKNYNDHYGHQEGDKVLKLVSSSIKESVSGYSDDTYVFRLGGEEFGIITKFDTLDSVKDLSNTIKNNIEKLNIEHKKSCCSDHLTISIGIYFSDGLHISNEDDIYRLADEELYKSKHEGRNIVNIYVDTI